MKLICNLFELIKLNFYTEIKYKTETKKSFYAKGKMASLKNLNLIFSIFLLVLIDERHHIDGNNNNFRQNNLMKRKLGINSFIFFID